MFLLEQKMGKRKLRSSIKALYQALLYLRPTGTKTMAWVCVQEAKTHSFREVYNSFGSIYYSSSTDSSNLCNFNEDSEHLEEGDDTIFMRPPNEESFWTSSSSLLTNFDDSNSAELILKNSICSPRFFFTPCTTKSIMGINETAFSEDCEFETEETEETEERDCMIMEMGFSEDNFTIMAMASENPYVDFRVSMEEMVEAHNLREWSCLQELLHCYLTLNDSTTHKIIVWAFVDLILNLKSDENINSSSSNNEKKENLFPLSYDLPLCLAE